MIIHLRQIWEPFGRFLRCLHRITPLRFMRLATFFDDPRDQFFILFSSHTPCYLASLLFFLAEGNSRFTFSCFLYYFTITLTNCLTYSVGMLLVAFGIQKEMVWADLLVGATSSHHSFLISVGMHGDVVALVVCS